MVTGIKIVRGHGRAHNRAVGANPGCSKYRPCHQRISARQSGRMHAACSHKCVVLQVQCSALPARLSRGPVCSLRKSCGQGTALKKRVCFTESAFKERVRTAINETLSLRCPAVKKWIGNFSFGSIGYYPCTSTEICVCLKV